MNTKSAQLKQDFLTAAFLALTRVFSLIVPDPCVTMAAARKFRALSISMSCMGPQEGIAQQINNVRLGRTCTSALAFFSAESARYEAMLIFDRQDDMQATEWKIRIQDKHDLRMARMAYDLADKQEPFDPI